MEPNVGEDPSIVVTLAEGRGQFSFEDVIRELRRLAFDAAAGEPRSAERYRAIVALLGPAAEATAPASSLYDWFDAKVREQGGEQAKYEACAQIVHHLGVLAGLGSPRTEVEGFLRRVHDLNERLMGGLLEKEGTLGQKLDEAMARGRRGDFSVIQGGGSAP